MDYLNSIEHRGKGQYKKQVLTDVGNVEISCSYISAASDIAIFCTIIN